MVIQHTLRSILVAALAAGSLGCTSLSAPAQDSDTWKAEWKDRAARWAEGAAEGADAAGDALTVAASGVANGFEDPDSEQFGAFPKGYPEHIRQHLVRFEGFGRDASYRFKKPVKGYMTKGLLLGGGVEWQGWLVDVLVEVPSRFEGQNKAHELVVRMRDGEVIEVHEARYAAALRRLESARAKADTPASSADGS